jgi:hypothetical protein
MFKVLYAPFEGVQFWRAQPEEGTPAVLAYLRPSCARVFICVEQGKEETELPMVEAAAEFLNCSPSFEFTRLMLRSMKDAWIADLTPKDSKLMRTLRFRRLFRLDERQPPFAPNNGSRLDGIW